MGGGGGAQKVLPAGEFIVPDWGDKVNSGIATYGFKKIATKAKNMA